MAKKWRCTAQLKSERLFTVGKVYTEGDNRTICNDKGQQYVKCGCSSAVEWLEKHGFYKFEEVSAVQTLSDLQENDVLLASNGRYYLCMSGGVYSETASGKLAFVRVISDGEHGWMDSADYAEDMTHPYSPQYTIDRVYRPKNVTAFPSDVESLNGYFYDIVFDRERDCPKPKELTVAEIEKLLGYSVKIVKEG